MTNAPLLLVIDQGTTSSRAMLFTPEGVPKRTAQAEFAQSFPGDGMVEHDADEIWSDVSRLCTRVMREAGVRADDIAGIGITNQRETVVLWDRETGAPLAPAIVWQDRRTAAHCFSLKEAGHEQDVTARSGLLLDPYFSATKLAWLLDNVPGARARADRGELAAGTIDSWLLWKLTGGRVHATDTSNAARTMLFNIYEGRWDPALLALFDVPESVLPAVRDTISTLEAPFGTTQPDLFGAEIPVLAMAGDQQAATFGQACFTPGMVKTTYGTGAFAVQFTGDEAQASNNRLLTTIAWGHEGARSYALEGSIFVAGAAVQWLRDGLGIIAAAAETEALAASVPDSGGVWMVPAFTGLGAPWWDAGARGAITGLTRDSTKAHIVRACLEAQALQTADLVEAMIADTGAAPPAMRVDGGMVANNLVCQMIADQLQIPVERPKVTETTALGAAMMAGHAAGVSGSMEDIAARWACERAFEPKISADQAAARHAGWKQAVARVKSEG